MNTLVTDIKNWRTTAVGSLTGLILCATQIINLFDNDPQTIFELSIFIAGLGALGIGVFAKDGDKSSAKLGIK